MMKKLCCMLLCVMLTMLAMAPAMACSNDRVLADLRADVNLANREIAGLVRVAQATPYDDVAWMQASIRVIVSRVKTHARLVGAEIGCDMVSYYIDGRWVDVDPLYVINIRQ